MASGSASSDDTASALDERMMRRALELAREAIKLDEAPIGAVVYETETGRIVGEGLNRREIDNDPTAHAEVLALRAAGASIGDWRLNDCTLVVTLEPCAMCAGAIVNARVGRLVFGAKDPKAGSVVSLFELCSDVRLNHRLPVIAGLMEEECGELLRSFFKAKRGG